MHIASKKLKTPPMKKTHKSHDKKKCFNFRVIMANGNFTADTWSLVYLFKYLLWNVSVFCRCEMRPRQCHFIPLWWKRIDGRAEQKRRLGRRCEDLVSFRTFFCWSYLQLITISSSLRLCWLSVMEKIAKNINDIQNPTLGCHFFSHLFEWVMFQSVKIIEFIPFSDNAYFAH